MFPNLEEYHRPDSVDDAIALLNDDPAERVILAGGTSLIPHQIAPFSGVVDIQDLGFEGIQRNGDLISIGALTTISDLRHSDRLAENNLDPLIEAAVDKPSQLKRNQATVGGELASADPRAEIPAVLLALDAKLDVEGVEGARRVALNRLYDDHGQLTLGDTEIIKSIEFECPADDDRLFYDRLSRTENDISLVNCAFYGETTDQGYEQVRVVAGAVDDAVIRLPEVETFVEDLEQWTPDAEDQLEQILEDTVYPPDDFRASSDYRRTVLGVFIKRAVTGEDPGNPDDNGAVTL